MLYFAGVNQSDLRLLKLGLNTGASLVHWSLVPFYASAELQIMLFSVKKYIMIRNGGLPAADQQVSVGQFARDLPLSVYVDTLPKF